MPILEMQTNILLVNTVMNKFIKDLMAPTESDTFGIGKMIGFILAYFRKFRVADIPLEWLREL
jgi:hypothetical protein